MKRIIISAVVLGMAIAVKAGNPARTGTAGATELMINPWANSSGWNSINTANVKGVEAFNLNIAGLTKINSTNVGFSYVDYLHLASIKINSFGIAQKIGDQSYIGLSVFSMNFGNIERTDVNNPDGGIGTFSPRFNNFSVGYGHKFSEYISCGLLFRGISESGASDVKARTGCMDAGVQYSGKSKKARKYEVKGSDIHLGISLRSVGVNGTFSGDGLSYSITDPDGVSRTMQIRSAPFQLPTQLYIGVAYDIRLDKDTNTTNTQYNNRLTIAGNFTSNAYANNQLGLGLEYGFKKVFAIRAGYQYENKIFDKELRINAFSGLAAGASIYIPVKKGSDDNILAFDYSYRDSRFLGATHSFGVRIDLGSSE
jgi:hypothetical protein